LWIRSGICGIISRLDLAEVLEAVASTQTAAGKTLDVYYRDTAQPVDMYASRSQVLQGVHSRLPQRCHDAVPQGNPFRLWR
jgi:hypothetical protein